MEWLVALFRESSVAHAVLMLSLTVTLGYALGSLRVFGTSLGVSGVLFAGLLFGHFGLTVSPESLEFLREFGLVLFVYAIGMQVGPGFFSSLRRQGLWLNIFAVANIIGGTLLALLIAWVVGFPVPVAVGILSGAATSTPGLGAAQQALKGLPNVPAGMSEMVGLSYAVTYPLAVVGIIAAMACVKRLFRIDVAKESKDFELLNTVVDKAIVTRDYRVTNANLSDRTVSELLELCGSGIVVTRILHEGAQRLAVGDSTLQLGDILHAVGTGDRLEKFRVIVGEESDVQLAAMASQIAVRRVIVTKKEIVGHPLETLKFDESYGVIITRIGRSGIEFTPTKGMRIQMGDRLMVVGDEAALDRVAKEVGDSLKELDTPHVISVFVGIALGVIVGSIPVRFPGIPVAVKFGLAGGPLLVAIILGRIGRVGPFLNYNPNAAKVLLREFGISLFLACVGMKSGERLFDTLRSGLGFRWIVAGIFITFLPLLLVAVVARAWKKLNYVTLCGLLAGSMTDSPALAYATQVTKNDASSIAYATVYPLTMLLRVVIAQLLILFSLRG